MGLEISAGWIDENEWIGFLEPNEKVSILNPDRGYIVSANNRVSSSKNV